MVLPSLRPNPLLAAASVRARPSPRLGFRLPPTLARHPPSWTRTTTTARTARSRLLWCLGGAHRAGPTLFSVNRRYSRRRHSLTATSPASSRVPIAVRRRVAADAAARPAGVPGCTERRLNSDRTRGMRRRK